MSETLLSGNENSLPSLTAGVDWSNYDVTCKGNVCTAKLKLSRFRPYPVSQELLGPAFDRLKEKTVKLGDQEGAYFAFGFTPEIAAINKKEKTVDFIASTEELNRNGYQIMQDGWQLNNFLANPVHLWAHMSFLFPIGHATRTLVERKQLVQTIKYTPVATFQWPETVFQLIASGTLKGISVGFIPIEFEVITEEVGEGEDKHTKFVGIRFIKQELLETSTVPIPADAGTLVVNKAPTNLVVEGVISEQQRQEYEIRTRFIELEPACAGRAEKDKHVQKPALGAEDKKELMKIAAVVPFRPHAKAPRNTPWNAAKELRQVGNNLRRLRAMSTVVVGEGDKKGDFKLPHHRARDLWVVFRGVSNALARLNQTQMDEADRPGARRHLVRERERFERADFDAEKFEGKLEVLHQAYDAADTEEAKTEIFADICRHVEVNPDEVSLEILATEAWEAGDFAALERIDQEICALGGKEIEAPASVETKGESALWKTLEQEADREAKPEDILEAIAEENKVEEAQPEADSPGASKPTDDPVFNELLEIIRAPGLPA